MPTIKLSGVEVDGMLEWGDVPDTLSSALEAAVAAMKENPDGPPADPITLEFENDFEPEEDSEDDESEDDTPETETKKEV